MTTPDIDVDNGPPLSPEEAARVQAKMEALAADAGIEVDDHGRPRLSPEQAQRFVDLVTSPSALLPEDEQCIVPMGVGPKQTMEKAMVDIVDDLGTSDVDTSGFIGVRSADGSEQVIDLGTLSPEGLTRIEGALAAASADVEQWTKKAHKPR